MSGAALIEQRPVSYAEQYFRGLLNGQPRGLRESLLRGGLAAASLPYEWVVRLRNHLYDAGWIRGKRTMIPVVSVGNLTVGGTGKTPCVEYVAKFFRRNQKRVVILSRGYGRQGAQNDEALVLEANLPQVQHLQGPNRARLAAVAAEELAADVLVLDDGFQHRRLERDLDLVLIDATDPWGLGRLLPRGFLREPLESLQRAGIVLLTHCDQRESGFVERLLERVAQMIPGRPVVRTRHKPLDLVNAAGRSTGLDEIQGKAVAAFCGIGNPETFRGTLAELGARVVAWRVYGDHHPYPPRDVEQLHAWAEQQSSDCLIATTQKDLVKLRHTELGGRPLWAVRIGLHVLAGKEALERRLRDVLSGRQNG